MTRDDTIDHVMQTMTAGRFRHLPIVEDGRLIGIISIGDVVKRHVERARQRASGSARIYRDGLGRRTRGGVCPGEFDVFPNFGGRLADRLAAEFDQFVGAVELEHADVADSDLHQSVRRIASES